MPTAPAVTADTFGAWLLKASPADGAVERLVRSGFEDVSTRCVRASYRTALVRAGQPVLLWVSGADARHPPGIHAAGHTTGPVEQGSGGSVIPVRLAPLEPMVPREALKADPVLGRLEVLRMPAGSNPSYLDTAQYAALREAFPQVDHRDRPDPGTA